MRILKNDINTVKQEYELANNLQAKATEEAEKLARAMKSA